MQGEGEGTLIPPLVPEIVQTNTDVILGSSPDQGKAEHLPVPKPTENDPTISDAQVRGTGTTQGATAHPPGEPLAIRGRILGVDNGAPPGILTGPHIPPRENICVLDGRSLGEHNRANPWVHDANHMFRWQESESVPYDTYNVQETPDDLSGAQAAPSHPPQLSSPELQTIHLPEFNATRLTDLASGSGPTTGEEGEVNPPPIVQETAWPPAKLIMDLCTGMSGGKKGEGKGLGPSSATKRESDQTLLITNLGLDVEMSGATEGKGKGPGPPLATSTEGGQNPLISHSGREPHPWGEGEGGDRGGSHNPPQTNPGTPLPRRHCFRSRRVER